MDSYKELQAQVEADAQYNDLLDRRYKYISELVSRLDEGRYSYSVYISSDDWVSVKVWDKLKSKTVVLLGFKADNNAMYQLTVSAVKKLLPQKSFIQKIVNDAKLFATLFN